MTRILVVDRSELLAWVVERLSPPDVVIERASSFADAKRALVNDPPDAAVFHLERCHASWRTLIACCLENPRVIPFVCTGEPGHFDACGCDLPCRIEDFMPINAIPAQFTDRIGSLIAESESDKPLQFRRGREPWADTTPERRKDHARKI